MINKKIIEWIPKLPYWQQYISKKIFANEILDEEDLVYIYKFFKKENNLSEEVLKEEKISIPIPIEENDSVSIRWKALKNVKGVNALKNDTEIKISNNLTLVYGKNGSGKSGYTRLLNNTFVSRGDKSVLRNIYDNKNIEIDAEFVFEETDSNELKKYSYAEIKNHPYSKRISVFDSKSAIEDLTNETELDFTPKEFIFFEKLLENTQKINEIFNDEISSKKNENEFINYFQEDSEIKDYISELNHSTNVEELDEKLKLNDLDNEKYKKISKRKRELENLDIEEKSKKYSELIIDLDEIIKKEELLQEKINLRVINESKKLIEKKETLKKISELDNLEQFEDYGIEKLGSKEWKEFIRSAQNYRKEIIGDIDYCIYCLQKTNEVTIIERYHEYLQSNSEKELEALNKTIQDKINKIKNIDTTIIVERSIIYSWIKEKNVELYNKLLNSEKNYRIKKKEILDILSNNNIKNNKNNENNKLRDMKKEQKNYVGIKKIIKELKKKQEGLELTGVSSELREIKNYEREYNAKNIINSLELIPKIRKYVNDQKWLNKAKSNIINTSMITVYQKKIFTEYITPEYITKFEDESKRLKAEFSTEIKQRGRRGATLKRLEVKGKNPADILSEGEQRVIAIANFLAETNLQEENIGIVFDDPVSSLDHTRREMIAERLVEQAKSKQVVIFTHDLPFLLSLENFSQKEKIDYELIRIMKVQKTTGIVDNEIPWVSMKVKKRLSYLRNLLQDIVKIERETTPENIKKITEYENEVKLWCEKLRETWERSIEEILLNDAIKRFRPSIETHRLNFASYSPELYKEIEKGMTDCSSWIHDRSEDLGEDIPDSKMLREYLDDCEKFRKDNNPDKQKKIV